MSLFFKETKTIKVGLVGKWVNFENETGRKTETVSK